MLLPWSTILLALGTHTVVHICRKRTAGEAGLSTNAFHGVVLGLAACVLSVPYDMPRWVLCAVFCCQRSHGTYIVFTFFNLSAEN